MIKMDQSKLLLEKLSPFFIVDEKTNTFHCRGHNCGFTSAGENLLTHLRLHQLNGSFVDDFDNQPAYGPVLVHDVRRRRNGNRNWSGNSGNWGSQNELFGERDREILFSMLDTYDETLIGLANILLGRSDDVEPHIKRRIAIMGCISTVTFLGILFPFINPLYYCLLFFL